jgi:hypothetical protein
MTHTAFTTLDRDAARFEIVESSAILRRFTTVTSFRAPYLKFPEEYVELLEADGFLLDSSQAKYKFSHSPSRVTALATGILRRFAPQEDTGGRARQDNRERIRRVPASVTSSVLRVARPIRNAYLSALSDPIVLFVHPWEFVDLRSEKLRLDCRFKTGDVALACVREVLETYVTRGARFVRMRELA